ncbi:predicted protein [Staphylococcus aureus subsp. aureus EMRSA16]|nr:predicted protein [Staphylococcus aureus subsp. aureus EMRSA16]
MTERKCTCNKLFSILVRDPNKEKLDFQFLQTMQVGVWALTQKIHFIEFYIYVQVGQSVLFFQSI